MTFDGFSWAALAGVAALTRAFLLGDGEAAAADLLGEALVNVGHDLLESRGIESLAQKPLPKQRIVFSQLKSISLTACILKTREKPKSFHGRKILKAQGALLI